jgi:hypothetical protein
VFLDASHVAPCPGDVNDDAYENRIPDFPHPFVLALGHVSGRHSHLPNGGRIFPVAVSEYIKDAVQLSTVAFVGFVAVRA